jgi:hypothetical protein
MRNNQGVTMRKPYIYRATKFDPNPTLYPEQERLSERMGERAYLGQVRNPFQTMMRMEFPERAWKGWDYLLLRHAPASDVDRLMEGSRR